MRNIFAVTGIAAVVAWITTSPALARGWRPEESRESLEAAERTVELFRSEPALHRYFQEAYGYAVFPTVGKAALFLGGAYGTGKVYEQGILIGSATISKASVGFQVGGEAYSEIIFFRNPRALERFKSGHLAFHAEASAAAATVGAKLEASWEGGVAIFTRSKGGLMASAAVGGQTFGFEPVSRPD